MAGWPISAFLLPMYASYIISPPLAGDQFSFDDIYGNDAWPAEDAACDDVEEDLSESLEKLSV